MRQILNITLKNLSLEPNLPPVPRDVHKAQNQVEKEKETFKDCGKAARKETKRNFKKFEFGCDCLISKTLSHFSLILY